MSSPVGHEVPENAHTAHCVVSVGQLPLVDVVQSLGQLDVVSPASQVPLPHTAVEVPEPEPLPLPLEP